ncbi:SH3 domain-binding glutamic acid-rich-like protein 3 isoform X2 [Epinephelus fuscoguttatus]|uniref:SH3 domain-binding glutamic acid-rich-like protein 3 isoform X2 n=1 Tax=Epinephelus fuscoguttatus TaxID=293821 RepID=UPI0020D1CE29|nr:SH3 domain-binding glutamic acid-rich-like protein 3 isoform X2 [Epinephelus fuscoguttatus]
MPLTVFYSSVTGNLEMKKQQQRIEMVLDSKNIKYNYVDIAADENQKALMRKLAGDPKALPPQICNGDVYCGVSLTKRLFKSNGLQGI